MKITFGGVVGAAAVGGIVYLLLHPEVVKKALERFNVIDERTTPEAIREDFSSPKSAVSALGRELPWFFLGGASPAVYSRWHNDIAALADWWKTRDRLGTKDRPSLPSTTRGKPGDELPTEWYV